MAFLPVTREEMQGRQPDFILITGDAYVDHPSFGHAIIGRLVESQGFSVAVIPQPQTKADYCRFGAPKYAFLISPGVVDSMVNNYTVALKRRKMDEYSEGGRPGRRPDRALTVYGQNVKRYYPNSTVICGGIEASLRRFAHYDYWKNEVMPSVLCDCKCDLLIYGMGEKPFFDLLEMVRRGIPIGKIKNVRGTCYLATYEQLPSEVKSAVRGESERYHVLPSFEEVRQDKEKYAAAFREQFINTDSINGANLIQQQSEDCYLVANSAQSPLTEAQMDFVYRLPYERTYHPMYREGIPAIEEVRFSITSHRGCFGSCSFCALNYHQGRVIQKRSKESIVEEAEKLTKLPDFKGNIHDVGGPSANFRNPACDKQKTAGVCKTRFCIGDTPCPNLKIDHREYLDVLEGVRAVPGVKRVFIRSGIRYDYLMYDPDETFFRALCRYYVSGQLKVAPEHCSAEVLKVMNKPKFELYRKFVDKYKRISKEQGKEQYIVPYFISSHPGCTLKDAIKLTEYLKSINYMPLQVQDFYPTPSTRSTCIFYTGIDPFTGKQVYVPRKAEEKAMQRALLQYRKPENRPLIEKALFLAHRQDLIGNRKECILSKVGTHTYRFAAKGKKK